VITKEEVVLDHRQEIHDALSTLGKNGFVLSPTQRRHAAVMQRKKPKTEVVWYWTTADKRKIRFEDLEPMHLVNILRLLECRARKKLESFYEFFTGLKDNPTLTTLTLRKYVRRHIEGADILYDLNESHGKKWVKLLDGDEETVGEENLSRGRDPKGYERNPYDGDEVMWMWDDLASRWVKHRVRFD
jgi:hypothetical protein